MCADGSEMHRRVRCGSNCLFRMLTLPPQPSTLPHTEGSNYSLPDKKCKTCNNPFHSQCLFKWFSSSQQSTCPLCRNIWMG
jgi:hypothetical protein